MPRPVLEESQLHPAIRDKVANLHADIVHNVQAAAASHALLVVGLAWNSPGRRARKLLDQAGITHHYLEFGKNLIGVTHGDTVKLAALGEPLGVVWRLAHTFASIAAYVAARVGARVTAYVTARVTASVAARVTPYVVASVAAKVVARVAALVTAYVAAYVASSARYTSVAASVTASAATRVAAYVVVLVAALVARSISPASASINAIMQQSS